MSLPSLLVAPGPTATTVASGRVPEVAEVGKKRPEEVFYRHTHVSGTCRKARKPRTNRFRLEALYENTVEEGKHAFNRLEGSSLRNATLGVIQGVRDVRVPFCVRGRTMGT
jgi:hypothetical protein